MMFRSKSSSWRPAEESENRLIYSTPELKTDLHLSGRASITLRLASSRPAANLSVYLLSLPWSTTTRFINDNLITRGWGGSAEHQLVARE